MTFNVMLALHFGKRYCQSATSNRSNIIAGSHASVCEVAWTSIREMIAIFR